MAHTIEPELLGSIPRKVRLRERRPGALGCVSGILLVIALFSVVGIGLLLSAIQHSQLALFGSATTGEVLRVVGDSGGADDGPTTRVDYAFSVDGRRVVATDHLSGDYQCCLSTPVPVLYLRGRLRTSSMVIPRGETVGSMVRGRWLFAGFWNAVLSPFLWLASIPFRQRRLIRRGQAVIGRVRSIHPTTNDNGTPNGAMIEYEFYPSDAESSSRSLVRGSDRASLDQAAQLRVDDPLTILYFPSKPRFNVAYRLSGFEVVPG